MLFCVSEQQVKNRAARREANRKIVYTDKDGTSYYTLKRKKCLDRDKEEVKLLHKQIDRTMKTFVHSAIKNKKNLNRYYKNAVFLEEKIRILENFFFTFIQKKFEKGSVYSMLCNLGEPYEFFTEERKTFLMNEFSEDFYQSHRLPFLTFRVEEEFKTYYFIVAVNKNRTQIPWCGLPMEVGAIYDVTMEAGSAVCLYCCEDICGYVESTESCFSFNTNFKCLAGISLEKVFPELNIDYKEPDRFKGDNLKGEKQETLEEHTKKYEDKQMAKIQKLLSYQIINFLTSLQKEQKNSILADRLKDEKLQEKLCVEFWQSCSCYFMSSINRTSIIINDFLFFLFSPQALKALEEYLEKCPEVFGWSYWPKFPFPSDKTGKSFEELYEKTPNTLNWHDRPKYPNDDEKKYFKENFNKTGYIFSPNFNVVPYLFWKTTNTKHQKESFSVYVAVNETEITTIEIATAKSITLQRRKALCLFLEKVTSEQTNESKQQLVVIKTSWICLAGILLENICPGLSKYFEGEPQDRDQYKDEIENENENQNEVSLGKNPNKTAENTVKNKDENREKIIEKPSTNSSGKHEAPNVSKEGAAKKSKEENSQTKSSWVVPIIIAVIFIFACALCFSFLIKKDNS